jgi:arylsulfatase A
MRSLAVALFALLTASGLDLAHAQDATPQRQVPNFILIFADDLGYGDLGCYGNPVIRTPALDRMAREGVRFTQFYSASPACTASRYGLLTGRAPARSGFSWVLYPKSKRGLHQDEFTLAELFQGAGYRTAIVGKWHLGVGPRFWPAQHGFDEYFGLPYSNDMRPPKWPSLPLLENGKVVEMDPDQSQLTERYTQRALRFVRENQERPFFLYLAHAMPHLPLYASEAFRGRSSRGHYGDVIEELDASCGRILAELRKLELERKTYVIFISDNGPWIIKGERGGARGPLRDGKGSTWEGGVRIPAICWGPGLVQSGVTERAVASTLDLLPSLAQLAGLRLPEGLRIDGEDRSSLLAGKGSQKERGPLFFHGPRHRLHALRVGPWKLHLHRSSQTRKRYFEEESPLLFHLERDPAERYPLQVAEPEVVQRLSAIAQRYLVELEESGSHWDN